MAFSPDYLETLKTRKAQSRVYKPFQLHGLELSTILKDAKHKALYIKLAKEYDVQRLRELAKDIAERKGIKHPGAYFMAVLMQDRKKYGWKKPEKKVNRAKKPAKLKADGPTNTPTRKQGRRKSTSRKNEVV